MSVRMFAWEFAASLAAGLVVLYLFERGEKQLAPVTKAQGMLA